MKHAPQAPLLLTATVLVAIAAACGWFAYKTRTDPRWMPTELFLETFADPSN